MGQESLPEVREGSDGQPKVQKANLEVCEGSGGQTGGPRMVERSTRRSRDVVSPFQRSEGLPSSP